MKTRKHHPGEDPNLPPGNIAPKDSAIDNLRPTDTAAADARAAINDLRNRATLGEFEAAWELVAIASETAHELFMLSKMKIQPSAQPALAFPVFQFIASISSSWPGLFYAHKEQRGKMERHVFKTLGLADYHPINTAGGFSFAKSTNAMAWNLYRRLNTRRIAGEIQLPLFSRIVSKDWWKAGRKEFVEEFGREHGGDFTKHPAFKTYRENAERSDKERVRKEKKAGVRSTLLLASQLRDEVRKAILKDMERSFATIAKRVDYKTLFESRGGVVRAAS